MSGKGGKGEDRVAPRSETCANSETAFFQHSKDIEKLKCQVRLCVMRILTDRLNRPAQFSEVNNTVVTQLILEYLEWMGYNRTLATFRTECRLSEERNRELLDQLAPQLSQKGDNVLPLICYLVNVFKQSNK